ncbi:TetR/AcrR family transcriptional regulator [Bradyrhizobium murdochi]|uniref:TetR/AcrR family transcriptional regulator n=1 Tax=Bradyrhizobium murdochi TaxID=1038859 RepID=UPI00048E84E6|nr:TetR/AcrR family transcriptional regulator [Bradyrhizobium murdochi]
MDNTRGSQTSIRDRILSAAFQSLKENGVLGASTLEIATRARVSKRELYTLFSNKDEIFLACIAKRASAISGSVSELPEPSTARELFGVLRELGFRLLKEVTRADVLTAFRFAIARNGDLLEVARIIDRNGRRASREALAKVIDHAVSRGLLKPSETKQMVRTYMGLLWSDLQVGLLLGVLKPPAEDEMKLFSEQAAREFLAIYGT